MLLVDRVGKLLALVRDVAPLGVDAGVVAAEHGCDSDEITPLLCCRDVVLLRLGL